MAVIRRPGLLREAGNEETDAQVGDGKKKRPWTNQGRRRWVILLLFAQQLFEISSMFKANGFSHHYSSTRPASFYLF